MRRSEKIMVGVCLVIFTALAGAEVTTATPEAIATQDLVKVSASEQVMAASWTRLPDAYILQVVLDPATYNGTGRSTPAVELQKTAAPEPKPASQQHEAGANSPEGNAFFISQTIANLRGRDPWIQCGRTLTLVEGRRAADGQPVARPDPTLAYLNQPYPPTFKERRVDTWLLKADGTQILPTTYSCAMTIASREPVRISYRFSIAAGEHAVAAAIRIDDDYFIEKLQPLEAKPAAR